MSNFAALVHTLRKTNRIELVPVLAAHAITSLELLRSTRLPVFVTWCLDANIPSESIVAASAWLQGQELSLRQSPTEAQTLSNSFTSRRKDLPEGRPANISKRSKFQSAISITKDPDRYKQEQGRFIKDQWAASSTGPKDSLWHTWCDFATAGSFEPLPVTLDLVTHMGTLFKFGEYGSAQNYFYEATARHLIETGFPVSVLIKKAIKAALRSIRRGLANSDQKRAMNIEFIPSRNSWNCSSPFPALPGTWATAPQGHALDPFAVCILGSWFICREIELAAARVRDLKLNRDLCTVSWNLPASKTDTAATGVCRTHGCSCSSDSATYNHLCPFHCAAQHLDNLRAFFHDIEEAHFQTLFLFPTSDGTTMDKDGTIRAIRLCAELAGSALTYVDARGQERQAFGGHALRVSGSQFLARHGVDTYLIQLIGRWGSNAILRYIQQAPLALQHRLASSLAHNPNIMAGPALQDQGPRLDAAQVHTVLKETFEELRRDLKTVQILATQEKELFIINVTTQCVHRPDPFEQQKPTAEWKAQGCQWRYGLLSHKRSTFMPNGPLLCPGCFGFKRKGVRNKLPIAITTPVQASISSGSDSKESQPDSEISDESDS